MIIKKNGKYAVECQVKMAPDCLKSGEYFDSEEEAREWVEDECWIYSGEGWICIQCNEHIMGNLGNWRRLRGT
ncbi:hypothetical protein UR09_03285 [Candidatus Nitromaritima sp. SCGC AAA799-A02]|nr:hypothetical protein UR09_03285 [Candidatus Nitromaritima sp. SCGC AAA799-A02]